MQTIKTPHGDVHVHESTRTIDGRLEEAVKQFAQAWIAKDMEPEKVLTRAHSIVERVVTVKRAAPVAGNLLKETMAHTREQLLGPKA